MQKLQEGKSQTKKPSEQLLKIQPHRIASQSADYLFTFFQDEQCFDVTAFAYQYSAR